METSKDRVERLLALLLLHQIKGSALKEKVKQLNLAGFSNIEIADLLQTNAVSVSKLLYETKRRSTSKK